MRRSPRSVLAWSRRAGGRHRHRRRRLQRSGNACTAVRAILGAPRRVLVAAHDLPLGATLGANDLHGIVALRVRDPRRTPWSTSTTRSAASSRSRWSRAAWCSEPHLTDRDRDGVSGLVPVGYRAVRVRPDDGLRPPAGAVVDVLVALDPTLSERRRGRGRRARGAGARRSSADDGAHRPTARALPSSSPRTRRAGSRSQRRTAS